MLYTIAVSLLVACLLGSLGFRDTRGEAVARLRRVS